jgi:hypothetical protein
MLPRALNFEATSGIPDVRNFYRSTSGLIPLLTSAGIAMMANTTAKRTIRPWFVPHFWLFLGDQRDAT